MTSSHPFQRSGFQVRCVLLHEGAEPTHASLRGTNRPWCSHCPAFEPLRHAAEQLVSGVARQVQNRVRPDLTAVVVDLLRAIAQGHDPSGPTEGGPALGTQAWRTLRYLPIVGGQPPHPLVVCTRLSHDVFAHTLTEFPGGLGLSARSGLLLRHD